jgi:hypothetical protein
VNGLPEKPSACLYAVAINKTKDYFKHLVVIENNNGIVSDLSK